MSESVQSPQLSSLLTHERCTGSLFKRFLLFTYTPLGIALFVLRLIIAVHIFFTACVLRKLMLLRSTVLRVMSCLLGVIVLNDAGRWDGKTRVLVANHVTVLDHTAVDLIEPCVSPIAFDIPILLRWCLGLVNFGTGQETEESVRRMRLFIQRSSLPLLTFPEGVTTNGRKGLLRFNTWPFEVTGTVQPVLISAYRPLFDEIAPSIVGSEWWQDLFYFFFVPFTILKVRWLHPMHRRRSSGVGRADETFDEFARRVESAVAEKLSVVTTPYTMEDVAEEKKRYWDEQRRSNSRSFLEGTSARISHSKESKTSRESLDSLTMKIKQVFPAVSLLAIREDLEVTRDGNTTCERISSGQLTSKTSQSTQNNDSKDWRKLFSHRKWNLIDANREHYLNRMKAKLLESGQELCDHQ